MTAAGPQPAAAPTPAADPPAAATRTPAALRFDWAAIVLFGLFVAGRVAIVLQGKVFTSFDSFSYAYRGDPAWDRGALVSFVGHAPRPWGVPLFYVLFPDDPSRAVGQCAVGTLAWALLAWAVGAFMRQRIARPAAIAAILLLGLTRTVSSWDFTILSESLSISLGVATLALLLWWLRTRAWWALDATIAVAVWWMFTRPEIFVMAAPIGVVLLWSAWRRRQAWPVVAALVLAFAAGWSYFVVGPNSVQTQVRWSFDPSLSHERGLLMYRLRISVFGEPETRAAFERELGMPRCEAAERVVRTVPGWAIEDFARAVDSCPELRVWTDTHLDDLWSRYATTMPGPFIAHIGRLTAESLSGAAYAETPALIPVPIEKILFSKRWVMPLTLGGLAVSMMVAFAAGARRRHPQLLITGIALAATALVSAALTVAVSAGEVWRFGLQETIAIRIAIIILLAAAWDSWLTSRVTSRRSGAPPARRAP